MKTYILTGGPGTGKSTILDSLEKGHGKYVIPEAAEDYIRMRQEQGVDSPWEESDFQLNIMKLQLQRKGQIPSGVEEVYIDRGIADGLAYDAGVHRDEIRKNASAEDITKIFVIEPLGFTETNEVRRENNDEALALGQKIVEIYKELGHEEKIVSVPAMSVEDRVSYVLKHTRGE